MKICVLPMSRSGKSSLITDEEKCKCHPVNGGQTRNHRIHPQVQRERDKQEGKLTVTNHLYQRHLSLEDYPSCKLCQFTSYQKAKFTKHGEWYLGDKMMQVGDGPEPPVSSYLQVWDNTTMLEEMLVVCPSRSLWSTGSRRGAQPAFRPLIVPVLLASAVPPYVSSAPPVTFFISFLPSSTLVLRPLQPYPRQPSPQINAGYLLSNTVARGAPAVIWRVFCEGAINQGVGTEEDRA